MSERVEQFVLGGGSVSAGPPPVPAVIFHAEPVVAKLPKANRPWCGHCLMIKHAAATGARRDVPARFLPLKAAYLITQVDGSTLTLCVQHAQDHQERGN